MMASMRINKYIADQGWASRREADDLIVSGKVTVNGVPAAIGQQVGPEDVVSLVGTTGAKQYLAYYKGRGIITHSPAPGETDIETRLRRDYSLTDVHPVGRLDKDSEGLIILSNDGRITGPLLDPDAGHEKEYDVLVDKPLTGQFLKQMERGVDIEGYRTKPAQIEKVGAKRFRLTITEGKKHQIRRMCAALGYQVQQLKRVRVLNIELGKLKPNQYRIIKGAELQQFLAALGIQENKGGE